MEAADYRKAISTASQALVGLSISSAAIGVLCKVIIYVQRRKISASVRSFLCRCTRKARASENNQMRERALDEDGFRQGSRQSTAKYLQSLGAYSSELTSLRRARIKVSQLDEKWRVWVWAPLWPYPVTSKVVMIGILE